MTRNIEININNGTDYDALYPKTLGSLVDGKVNSATTADNLSNISTALNGARIYKGQYLGTGEFSANIKKTVNLPFTPNIFLLNSYDSFFYTEKDGISNIEGFIVMNISSEYENFTPYNSGMHFCTYVNGGQYYYAQGKIQVSGNSVSWSINNDRIYKYINSSQTSTRVTLDEFLATSHLIDPSSIIFNKEDYDYYYLAIKYTVF